MPKEMNARQKTEIEFWKREIELRANKAQVLAQQACRGGVPDYLAEDANASTLSALEALHSLTGEW